MSENKKIELISSKAIIELIRKVEGNALKEALIACLVDGTTQTQRKLLESTLEMVNSLGLARARNEDCCEDEPPF